MKETQLIDLNNIFHKNLSVQQEIAIFFAISMESISCLLHYRMLMFCHQDVRVLMLISIRMLRYIDTTVP